MGGVVDGQAVSAAITNPAFLDANGDDTALGKISLANVDPLVSGPTVTNIQREINSLDSYTGRPAGGAYDLEPTFTNSQGFTATESLKSRSEALSGKFHSSTGHGHSGAAGDGGPVLASVLTSVPLKGYIIQGVDEMGVTGTSSDVSSSLLGKTPSSGPTVAGVVVTAPENKLIIRQASGVNTNDVFKNGLGDVVYARLTESAGVWTLSYFVDLSGVETAYSFAVSSDVRWYYQELFNPMLNPPVYSEFANIPSDNVTQSIIDATTTSKGKVLLSSSASSSVGSTNTAGTGNATVANADHVHQGVHSVQEFTEGVEAYGDIVLKGAAGTTVSRAGSTFTISAGGGLVPVQESPPQTPDGIITAFTLTNTPFSTDAVIAFINGLECPKADRTVSGTTVTFSVAPSIGQTVEFYYLKNDVILIGAITPKTEFRTLSAGEITAKQIVLVSAPVTAAEIVLDVIGGGPQFYGTDYTVSGSNLSWNGLSLDGILTAGDKLRVQYFY